MKLNKCNIFPNGLAIQWADQTEIFILYKQLRDACPCAYCSGETDVFGNIYIGQGIRKTQSAYEVEKIELVGHYAIRVFWKDNHNSGIYPFELLQKLNDASTTN
tara:strand:+ start:16368 stop:16679 length:312 start_codon:yes stop_codon:yes gene_type:complete